MERKRSRNTRSRLVRHWKSRTVREKVELAVLARMLDSAIDISDIPEITDWSEAQIGRFYRKGEHSV